MNLDETTDIEWFRKELKKHCAYIKKDINENFKANNWYPIEQGEYGVVIYDWNYEQCFDLFELNKIEDYIEVYK